MSRYQQAPYADSPAGGYNNQSGNGSYGNGGNGYGAGQGGGGGAYQGYSDEPRYADNSGQGRVYSNGADACEWAESSRKSMADAVLLTTVPLDTHYPLYPNARIAGPPFQPPSHFILYPSQPTFTLRFIITQLQHHVGIETSHHRPHVLHIRHRRLAASLPTAKEAPKPMAVGRRPNSHPRRDRRSGSRRCPRVPSGEKLLLVWRQQWFFLERKHRRW